MAHRQKHRGQHEKDAELFDAKWLDRLNQSVDDFSYLLSRGYSENAALKLVGDQFQLRSRQRMAIMRASCSDQSRELRSVKACPKEELSGSQIAIDAYNLLITIESALAGGYVINCRDGTYRDLASVHGTYRKVEETLPAFNLIGETLNKLCISEANWYLDAPVSNSGRLKILMLELAAKKGFRWTVELVNNPDITLVQSKESICITSDGWILDRSECWFNLQKFIVDKLADAQMLHLQGK